MPCVHRVVKRCSLGFASLCGDPALWQKENPSKNPRGSSSVVRELEAAKASLTHTHHTPTYAHTTLLKQYHVVLEPFVPSLCPVRKEMRVDVCGGRDPSQQTMSWLKRGFFLLSLWSLLVRCKFTWPFNSSPHKLLSFIQRLLFGHIRRHCCPGLSNWLCLMVLWLIMWKTPGHNNTSRGNMP